MYVMIYNLYTSREYKGHMLSKVITYLKTSSTEVNGKSSTNLAKAIVTSRLPYLNMRADSSSFLSCSFNLFSCLKHSCLILIILPCL